jgi:hypothetical protein
MVKRYTVTLTKEEREELQVIAQKGSHSSRRVVNALVLLNCDEGEFAPERLRGEDIARVLQTSMRRIDRVKRRFVEDGVDAALGSRKGDRVYERKADGDFEARLLALSCTKAPPGFARWSLRLLADKVVELGYIESVSYETVRRVLKKTRSSPGKRSAG